MLAQAYHAALVRLLDKLVAVLGHLRDEGLVVLGWEVQAVEQRADQQREGGHLHARVRHLRLVQQERLLDELV